MGNYRAYAYGLAHPVRSMVPEVYWSRSLLFTLFAGVVFVILLLASGAYRHDQRKKILSSRLFENSQHAFFVEFFVFEQSFHLRLNAVPVIAQNALGFV